jgi:FAD/FMN-containing dehydrogenase
VKFTRRGFLLQSSAAAVAVAWSGTFKVTAASAHSTADPPPGFPAEIEIYQQGFENWAGDIVVDDLWTSVARTPQDLITLANWARGAGWTLRARGKMHNWSPLSVVPGSDVSRVLLVDTTECLTAMSIVPGTPAAVRVQTGATMDALLLFLEQRGYGVTAHPAPGDITVGGALAIDGHGTAIPAVGETRASGQTYGTLSNLVRSLTAVVWDTATSSYVLRVFDRSHPDCKAFLTHLGRALLSEVTLAVGTKSNLRCQSLVSVPASELFAPAGSGGRTFSSYVAASGRVEAIWFPFTQKPWLKVWTITPRKPLLSRKVNSPYNYIFADVIPEVVSDLADQIISGNGAATPLFGSVEYNVVVAGLLATLGYDLWGAAKNTMLYVRPTTLRVTANGYAILCRRSDIQRVLNEFTSAYLTKVAEYRANGGYPMNGPVEIRVTGLDHAGDCGVPGAESPALSAVRPRADHPEWDVAVWLDILTFPGTPEADRFYSELEAWIYNNYSGSYSAVRVEWSKGWGYTAEGAWENTTVLGTLVPDSFRAGPDPTWDWAMQTLDAYDPARIFSNDFLDRLT